MGFAWLKEFEKVCCSYLQDNYIAQKDRTHFFMHFIEKNVVTALLVRSEENKAEL